MGVVDIKTRCELIPRSVLTELAKPVATILHIATGLGNEGGRVGLACLARWRRETSEFSGGADDGAVVCSDREKSFEQVVEWSQLVHPLLVKLEQVVSAIHHVEIDAMNGGGNDLHEVEQRMVRRHHRRRRRRGRRQVREEKPADHSARMKRSLGRSQRKRARKA